MNSFILQNSCMNQCIFQEGQTQEYIYIVVEGEFSVLKSFKKKKKAIGEDEHSRSFLGPLNHGLNPLSKITRTQIYGKPQHIELKKLQRTLKDYSIKILTGTRGQVLGLEDAVFGRNHTSTVKSISSNGQLYAINKNEFLIKFQKEHKSWNHIKNIAESQD